MKVWLQGWLTQWFGKIHYSFYVSDLFFFWLFYIMINSKMTAAPPELLMSNGKQRDLSSLQLFLRNVERSLANNTACTQALWSWGILQARILEWVAMPSFRGSSQTRDGSQVSHIAGRFFTIWATMESQLIIHREWKGREVTRTHSGFGLKRLGDAIYSIRYRERGGAGLEEFSFWTLSLKCLRNFQEEVPAGNWI